ncbi:MAG: 30S ribosomal protein S7 [Candidatus Heimdallarchaeota archaeon]
MPKDKKDKKVATKEKVDKKEKPAKKKEVSKKEEKKKVSKKDSKAAAETKKDKKKTKEAPKKEEKKAPKKEKAAAKVAPKETSPKKEEKKPVAAKKEEAKPAAEKEPKATKEEVKPKTTPKKQPKEEKVVEEKEEELPNYDFIKLFNKWSYNDIIITDPGLKAYISLRPVIIPHTGGRYAHQRFKKAEMPITERLVNKLMKTKRGTGKKERMIKAVRIAFEIINLQTGKNPIQVLVDAIQNTSPREEVTRITYGGMAQLQSVDVAPMRRIDISLVNIVAGVFKKSFNNILSAEEILAKELIDASENKPSSFAVGKMQEIERVALSAR